MLAGHIRTILAELTPTAERIAFAQDRAERLIMDFDRLCEDVHVVQAHLFGSVRRETALRGFRDIDFLLELRDDSLRLKSGDGRLIPARALRRVAQGLEHCRAGPVAQQTVKADPRSHCVAFEYPNHKLRVDLVPAFRLRGKDRFEIASVTEKRWIESRPFLLREKLDAAPPKVRDAIRLLKGWRRARGGHAAGLRLPSYAIATWFLTRPLPPQTTPPLELVAEFFDVVASSKASSRLVLRGPDDGEQMVLVSPTTRLNVLRSHPKTPPNVVRERKSRLIYRCRDARAALERIRLEAPYRSDSATLNALRAFFIGSHG